MDITYNLRSQQKLAFALIIAMLFFVVMIVMSLFIFLLSPKESVSHLFIMVFMLGFIGSIIVFGVAYYFLKDTQLIIKKTGMHTTNRLLSLHPQFATIDFHPDMNLYKVEDIGKTMLGPLAKLDKNLQKNDTVFAFVDKQKSPKQIFMMSNNIWEIENIDLLESQLNQLGLTVEVVQAKAFIEEFMPQMADLGKKAGYLAYGCLVPISMAFVIFSFFDTWSTIYYGAFNDVLWLVFFMILFMSIWYIKTNVKQLFAHIMVGGLFALSMVFFTVVSITAIVPILGKDMPLTFEYTKTNEFKEEIWTARENAKLKIFCVQKNDKNTETKPAIQKTTAKTWFFIIRVDGKKMLCPHGRYLSDAMLPHE